MYIADAYKNSKQEMKFKFHASCIIILSIVLTFVATLDDVVSLQEVAAKVKNAAVDVKDTLSTTGSTTQVKQFAEVIEGLKAELVDMFSMYNHPYRLITLVESMSNGLNKALPSLLGYNFQESTNDIAAVDTIKDNINRVAMIIAQFVKQMQLAFNDLDKEMPKISAEHLTNLLEVQQRARKTRIFTRQIGGFGK